MVDLIQGMMNFFLRSFFLKYFGKNKRRKIEDMEAEKRRTDVSKRGIDSQAVEECR